MNHSLADEDRRTLTEKRERIVDARKASGKPLSYPELRMLDCEIELELAKRAYDRDPGKPRILGDGTLEMSKQKFRVKVAERNLKAAKASLKASST